MLDDQSDDEDFAVCLDADGRVDGSAGACLCSTAIFDSFVALRGKELHELRTAALTAAWPLAKGAFWIGADAEPLNGLESLAQSIFRFHTAGSTQSIDVSRSGCEWWANVTKSELLASAACGDIGFHFDKDEHAFSQYGLCIHPLLSTVTYLTNDGAPTVVLPNLGLTAAAGGEYCNMAKAHNLRSRYADNAASGLRAQFFIVSVDQEAKDNTLNPKP